ncbi:MAG: HNH endonuclease [Desulfobacterales bacterium]|nr:MAG: HNH endonuclease [Desulfobacterales bacterium]
MSDDFFWLDGVGEDEIRRERARARDLRKTRWWQRKTAAGICYYCGGKCTHQELTMDHVVPLARGGRSTRDNLVPCCKDCNNRKKNMLPIEWEEYLDRIHQVSE